jgi:hypothetical protein
VSGVERFVTALERAGDDHLALAVDANLRVTVDDTPLAVTGSGERIRIGLPSLPTGLSLAVRRRTSLRTLAGALAQGGLTAEVCVGDAVVAILGHDADPSVLARTLALGPVEVRARGLLAALVHSR